MREKSSNAQTVNLEIVDFIKQSYKKEDSGIVYCYSRKECEQVILVAICLTMSYLSWHSSPLKNPHTHTHTHTHTHRKELREQGILAAFYHADMEANQRAVVHTRYIQLCLFGIYLYTIKWTLIVESVLLFLGIFRLRYTILKGILYEIAFLVFKVQGD